MELDVLAFGETLIAHIPVLRREAASLTPEPETAHRLVRATVAKAWQGRSFQAGNDMGGWLGKLLKQEYARGPFGEPRSFRTAPDA